MPSYLKFDGIDDVVRGTVPATWTALGSIVMTVFVRFLHLPKDTAPVIKLSETGRCVFGLWARGRDHPDGHYFSLSLTGQISISGIDFPLVLHTVAKPVSTVQHPSIGRVYKIQVVLAYDTAGGDLTYLVAFIDGELAGGTSVSTGTVDGLYVPAGATTTLCLGGLTEGAGDILDGIASVRAPHMDIIQAKVEYDRPITITSGVMVLPDADSQPFDNLTFNGSATGGALYLLNEGSGTAVNDTSGQGNNLSLVGGAADPDWAPPADPSFPSSGVARFTFDSIEGLALRHSDAADLMPLPIMGPPTRPDKTAGELRLRLKPEDWTQDGTSTDLWTDATGLTTVTTQSVESGRALRTNNAGAVTNRDAPNIGMPGTIVRRWARAWFYDPVGTSATRTQRFGFMNAINGLTILAGYHGPASTAFYAVFLSGNTVTSVPVSVGWHEILIYSEDDTSLNLSATRIYIDGTLVLSDAAVDTTGFYAQIGMRQNANGVNGDAFWDWMAMNSEEASDHPDHDGLVAASGSIVLPLLQPAKGVSFFRGVTITEVTAGANSMQIGTTTYTFRHSIDGGSNWSSPVALTSANLKALKSAANGQDVLENTVAQSSSMDDMGSPATRQIDLLYEPALLARILGRGSLGRRMLSNEMKREAIVV